MKQETKITVKQEQPATFPKMPTVISKPTLESVRRGIEEECTAICEMLLEKNKNYGNSALDPVRVFSKASPVEQLLVRLDDKLSRLSRGSASGEDVEKDLLGYLILLRVARKLGMK